MSNKPLQQFAEKWIDAYNSHDPDVILDLYDENVTNIQFPWGKSVQGRDAMRSTCVNVFNTVIGTRQPCLIRSS